MPRGLFEKLYIYFAVDLLIGLAAANCKCIGRPRLVFTRRSRLCTNWEPCDECSDKGLPPLMLLLMPRCTLVSLVVEFCTFVPDEVL